MTMRFVLSLALLASLPSRAADETQDAPSLPTKTPNKGKLVASEFCPIGAIGSPVGISVDDQGRVFVTETHRRTMGELDIRKHFDFLGGALASMSIEDKRAFIRANYKKGEVGDANGDGVQDWKDLLVPSEIIQLLIDKDGDGKMDSQQIFADGFNTEVTGVAGGVLAFGGSVYTTIQPDLWKLTDTTNAGKADQRQSLAHGFGLHIGYGGHDMHGPTMGPDGRIYWSMGDKGYNVTTREGKHFHHPYEGAVFRVEPDGSHFEVFAFGLRNPQELAFDDFGNLFNVDNDADIGDRERFVYITEQSDSGWRATYQYRNRKVPGLTTGGYNPWMAEELWKPKFDTQAAYLTPALANYSDGPCGFKFNPGTALSDEYRGHFFLTMFPKKLLTCFKAEPDGAGFKMANERVAFSGLMLTGIAFGPDGAVWAADWGENAWAPHQKGRVVRIDVPGTASQSALRVETARMLKEGMKSHSVEELTDLLAHADQRIRLRAQFELVNQQQEVALVRVAKTSKNLLARIHAIWGLGQLGRKDPDVMSPVVNLLKDDEPEIRAQAAKVLGDAPYPAAANDLAGLLKDSSPHVRLLAGLALAKLGNPSHLDAIVSMLSTNKGRDAFLRHAGIIALAGCAAKSPDKLADLSTHPNRHVRLAAIVALRRLSSPLVAKFLDDKDEWVLAEAARAIHDDFSIPQAREALAKLLDRPGLTNEPLLRRAIDTNLCLGDPASAARLVSFASTNAPAALRAEALDALAEFAAPNKLDRIQGRYRDLGKRDETIAHHALDPAITRLLKDVSPAVRNATVNAIAQLNFSAAKDRLAAFALDETQPDEVRAVALTATFALKSPRINEAVEIAINHPHPRLRAAGLAVLGQLQPDKPATLDKLKEAIKSGSPLEQQAALAALGYQKSKDAGAILDDLVTQLVEKKASPWLQLDILESATAYSTATKNKTLADRLKKYQSAKPKNDRRAAYAECLVGGDAMEGEIIFKSGQCTQCHTVNGSGGAVGPDLSQVAQRLPRIELLESIVNPQAKLAAGYATISVTNKSGDTLTGNIQSETKDELVLKDDEGQLVKIKKSDIDSQTAPTTAMPPMSEVLKPREIRDVVEYLSGLK